jgi:transcriptional regulator with XRE-family HTH domain
MVRSFTAQTIQEVNCLDNERFRWHPGYVATGGVTSEDKRWHLREQLIERGLEPGHAKALVEALGERALEARNAVPLGVVVGENLRRLRDAQGLTQDEAADRLRAIGLSWSRSHVAAIETGNRESMDLLTAVLVATVLRVEVGELFGGDGMVRYEGGAVPRSWLRDIFRGGKVPGAVEVLVDDDTIGPEEEGAFRVTQTAAFTVDAAIARSLQVRPEDIAAAARKLWNQTALQERDRRVAELGDLTARQRQAHRGHVTRALTKEIKAHLAVPAPTTRRKVRGRAT